MAPSPKHLSLLTLLCLISSFHVQARESVFFNKSEHYNTSKETDPVQKEAPSPKQQDPINYTQENQNGYGLYGHGSLYQPSPTKTINDVKYTNTAHNIPSEFPTEEYTMANQRSYMNEEFTTSYPKEEFDKKQYGMSDTRFLENGRYFYNVNAENNYANRYESGRRSSQRYGSYGNTDPINKHSNSGGYYGNNEKAYEHNTSNMEGYKGNQENEEDYWP